MKITVFSCKSKLQQNTDLLCETIFGSILVVVPPVGNVVVANVVVKIVVLVLVITESEICKIKCMNIISYS